MLPIVLEKLKARLTCTPARTRNRIRSPRRAALGPWSKVGKRSRQNRAVTLGKRFALRVGHMGVLTLMFELSTSYLNASWWMVDSCIARIGE